MTLAVRNSVLLLGAILALAALVGFVVGGISLWSPDDAALVASAGPTLSWYGISWEVDQDEALYSLVAAGVLSLISLVGLAGSARLFRRVNSAEIYFVAIFMLSACAEVLRLVVPLAQIEGRPADVVILVTRAVLFARLVGSLSLFAAGVYAAGADYPRIGTISAILVGIGFAVVYFMPIDNSQLAASYLYQTDRQIQLDLITGFLSAGAIINFVIGWFRGHRDQSVPLVLAAAATVVGKELVLNVASPGMLASGLILAATGIAGIILVNRSYYLWS